MRPDSALPRQPANLAQAQRLGMFLVSRSLFLCLLTIFLACPAWSAVPTVTSSSATRGTLTFGSDAIVFKTAKQEERFQFDAKRLGDTLAIPGLRVLDFQHREIVSPGSKTTKPASVLTFQCEDGSKLGLILNEPVDVLRVEITYSDRTKAVLWKLASEIQ